MKYFIPFRLSGPMIGRLPLPGRRIIPSNLFVPIHILFSR